VDERTAEVRTSVGPRGLFAAAAAAAPPTTPSPAAPAPHPDRIASEIRHDEVLRRFMR
jgi:hypothetical protein